MDLENGEREKLIEKISKIVKQTYSVMIVPISQSCFQKKEKCCHQIKFDMFKVNVLSGNTQNIKK